MNNGYPDIDPEGSNYYPCCGSIYTYGGHEDPGGFDPDCPEHGWHRAHRRPGHHDELIINGWCCVLGQFRGNFCELCDETWPCASALSASTPPEGTE